MKLKRIAVRGLIIVAICVALCMFFSGTIENITTPKVKLAKVSRGKLTEVIELDAQLIYPETQQERIALLAGQTLSIARVNVREGYAVKAGDVVLEASITNYDALLKQAQDEYDAALDAMMELERKNEGLTLRRSELEYADAHAALRSATRETARAKTRVDVLLRAQALSLPEQGYPEGASEELIEAIDAYRAAELRQAEAQEAFGKASRYGVSDAAWTYISAHQSASEKLDDCEQKLIELQEKNIAVREIRAPHDGVIAHIELKAGDVYDGNAMLYAITKPDTTPALRAEIKDVDKSIAEGTKLYIALGDKGMDAKVTSVGYTDAGIRCADVALSADMLKQLGGSYALSGSSVKLRISFKAAQSTSLLPASAVRGSGDSRYVYVVNERSTVFGKRKLSIEKMDVNVIAEADGVSSVEEELSYYSIAYMEDRALREGCDVMQYVE